MSLIRKLLAAAAILAATAATPAFADSYNLTGTEPLIYQTNWLYSASPIVPSGVPAGSTVTTVGFSWGYTTAGPLTHPYTLYAKLCNGSATSGAACGQTTSGSVVGSTYWANQLATQAWNFSFIASSSYNETMKPSALSATTSIHLTVNYNH